MRKVFVEPVVLPEPRFRDGLGIRYVRTDSTGDPVEVLRPLWDVAAMRASIQHRVSRLLSFRQARFITVRAAEVPADDASTIEVVSDYVSGHRFSEILEASAAGAVALDSTAALHVVREVLGALAVLHESRAVTHGAVAPERILLTPKGRVVVADYVLGPAIERLDFSRSRLWREFRIPVAPGKGTPKLDEAADVVQVGVTAAALLAGRPIDGSEYPSGLPDLVASLAQSRGNGENPSVPAPLLAWLKRALHLDQAGRFANVREARMALEAVLSKHRAATGGASALKSLAEAYGRYAAVIEAEAAARASALAAKRAAEQAQAADASAGQTDGDPGARVEPGTVLVPAFTLLPEAPIESGNEAVADAEQREEEMATDGPSEPPVGWRVPEPSVPDVALVAGPLIQDETPAPSVADGEFPEEVLDLGGLVEEDGPAPPLADEPVSAAPVEAAEAAEVAGEAPALDISTTAGTRSFTEDVLDLDAWLAEDSATLPALRRLLHGHKPEITTEEANPEATEPPEPESSEQPAIEVAASAPVAAAEPPPLPEVELATVEADPEIAALFLSEAERPVVRDLVPVDTMPTVKPLPLPEVELAVVEAEPEVAALFQTEEEPTAVVESVPAELTPAAQPTPEPLPEVELATVEAEPEAAGLSRGGDAVPAVPEPVASAPMALEVAASEPDACTTQAVEPPADETEPAVAALFHGEASVLFVPGRAAQDPPPSAESAPRARSLRTLPESDVAELLLTNWLVEVDLDAARPDVQPESEPPLAVSEPPAAFLQRAPAVNESASGVPDVAPLAPPLESAVEEPPEPETPAPAQPSTPGYPEAMPLEPEESGPVFPRVAPSIRRVRAEARRRRLARVRAGAERGVIALFHVIGTAASSAAAGMASFSRGLVSVLLVAVSALWTLVRGTAGLGGRALIASARGAGGVVRVTARGVELAAGAIARGGTAAVRGLATAIGGAAAASAVAARTLAGGFLHMTAALAAVLSKTARRTGSAGLAALTSLSRASGSAVRAGAGLSRQVLSAIGRGATGGVRAAAQGLAATVIGLARAVVALGSVLGRGAAGLWSVAVRAAGDAACGTAHAGAAAGQVLVDGGRRAARVAGRTGSALRIVPSRLFFFVSDVVDRLPRPTIRPSYLAAALLVIVGVAGVPYARARWFTPAPQVGTVRVEAQKPGLTVRIDGAVKGEAPLSATLAVGRHRVEVEGGGRTRVHDVDVSAGHDTVIQAAGRGLRATGSVRLSTEPPGAQVWIDGVTRGQAPVTINDIAEGPHTVLVRDPSGSVRRTIQVKPEETTDATIQIRPGWLAVFAPVRLDVLEEGKPIGSTEGGRMLARPGDHTLEFVSQALGFREMRRVEVKPGEVAALTIALPPVALEVVAPPGAEILIDGESVGTAPLRPINVAVGTREVLMRHPTLGERRQVVSAAYGRANRIVFE